MRDITRSAIHHHQPTLPATLARLLRDAIRGQLEIVV
jgi:hypothetical protein